MNKILLILALTLISTSMHARQVVVCGDVKFTKGRGTWIPTAGGNSYQYITYMHVAGRIISLSHISVIGRVYNSRGANGQAYLAIPGKVNITITESQRSCLVSYLFGG